MNEIYMGIDIGSRTTKLVILDKQDIIYHDMMETGMNSEQTVRNMIEKAIGELLLSKVATKTITTGYGRKSLSFSDGYISEITCHCRGVSYFNSEVRTIIDIGGQDCKVISVSPEGKVMDFVMNDKCAAGTGRFLEVTARILGVSLDQLGELSMQAENVIPITQTCVVFAESEIIGLIGDGKPPSEIIAGVHRSIAKRIKQMMSQISLITPIVFTGGVAKNLGMKQMLSEVMETQIFSPEDPFITGAIGAALYAREL
jgi:predicted CoA-substrate-specific enzyme activase